MSPLGARLAALTGRDDERWPAVGRMRWSGWPTPALRSLGLLLAVGAVVVGWWWWSGRPAAVSPVIAAAERAMPVSSASPQMTTLQPTPTMVLDPPPTPVLTTAPPDLPVVVHVTGLVRRPGLVTLSAGARVADAVAAAGGVTRPRAADTVNLARPVVDGEQIAVGVSGAGAGSAPPATASGPASGPAPSGGQAMAPTAPVDLNSASVESLDALPGLGPVLSGRIVEWRAAHGPFRSVDELGEVVGIGDALVARLRPHLRV